MAKGHDSGLKTDLAVSVTGAVLSDNNNEGSEVYRANIKYRLQGSTNMKEKTVALRYCKNGVKCAIMLKAQLSQFSCNMHKKIHTSR